MQPAILLCRRMSAVQRGVLETAGTAMEAVGAEAAAAAGAAEAEAVDLPAEAVQVAGRLFATMARARLAHQVPDQGHAAVPTARHPYAQMAPFCLRVMGPRATSVR
jgi:hypothetical protein